MPSLLRVMLFALLATLWGCSGKSNEDHCAGVTCERGVCDEADGTCRNAGSCVAEEQCLQGWLCSDAGCIPAFPCDEDGSCERGVCEAGACVNGSSCASQQQCVIGYRCNAASQCDEDPCASVDCVRGVCNPMSQMCVSSGICTAATEERDCLSGHFCYGQSCQPGEAICAELDCLRGVCDPAVAECVEPEVCASDAECLDGNYCGEGACLPNQCDAQMRVCARGVCDPVDGRCKNGDSCEGREGCVDGFSCVRDACVALGEECGDECRGTQLCVYIPETLDSVCEEGSTCYAATDCLGGRACIDGVCGPAGPCVPDALEPNDDTASAVAMASQPGNYATGSICSGDVDVFSFNTANSQIFRGLLVVDLAIEAVDVGLGSLEVEVRRPNGTVVGATTDSDGIARVVLDVGVLELGTYEIRVLEDTITAAGVRYGLFADLLDQPTVDACAAALPLGTDTVSGNTNSGASYLLSTSCSVERNQAGEDVYTFEVTTPSYVRIVVNPQGTADVAVSLQRRCEAPRALACANNTGGSGTEILTASVPPGRYFVIVEGGTASSGGPYELSLVTQPVICGRADASCVDATTSQFCNGQGTGFEEETCAAGCTDATGRCARLLGDVCFTALDASNGLVDVVDWDTLTNDYDPGDPSCVPNTFGTQTAGPDSAYMVTLPPAHVLHAVQTLSSGDRGSLYLVQDCQDLSTCITGVNANTGLIEELTYFNTGATTQTLWLIADTEADSFGYGIGNITISVQPTICTPGALRCAGADVAETCTALGTGWDSAICTFGCAAGSCAPVTNNLCAGAIDLIANGPFTGRIGEYFASYNPGFSGCTARSSSGPDAVFSVTPAAGEVALVAVTADFDVSLWASSDCGNLDGSCVAGSDFANRNDETIEFAGDGTTTYYVVVDSQFSGSGLFTVSATLQQPTCTPGVALQCLDTSTLEYCTPLGIEAPYTCATTCTAAACDMPRGQICADPIVLVDGQSVSGIINVPNSINPGVGVSGACTFPSDAEPYGSDIIYAVDLLAGEWLFADYTMNSSFAILYALSDCSDTDTCLARSTEGLDGNVVIEALTNQRVYLVLDRTTTSVSSISFTLDVDIRRQDCVVGTAPFCNAVDTLEYCDNLGFTREYLCNGTCNAGACDAPTGDECIDAIRVQPGQVVTGDWLGGKNNVQPTAPLDGSCEFDGTTVPTGPEDIYVIDLLPGDLLRATLTTNYGSAYHYILSDCFDTSSCQDNNFDRASGVVMYHSSGGGPAYVVVDASSTFNSSSPYTLEFDVAPAVVCAPNSTSCDAGSLSVCDSGGGSIGATSTCAAGCATPESCALELASNLCATAPLTTGTSVYGNFAALTNDLTISSSGCTGNNGAGNDLIYAVSAGPGDILHATVKSLGFEAVQVYIASDCANPESSCQAGARGDSKNRAEVYFAPTTFGTYYVVAEATSSFADEAFRFDLEVLAPECSPGAYTCAPSGQSMLQCNQYGIWETYPCVGGCANDQCGSPVGQACFDAIPLVDGDSVIGSFDVTDKINPGPGQVGGCNFGALQANGADTIYSVDLLAGDVLDVSYSSSSSFGILYLLSDCTDGSSCLANTVSSIVGSLQYSAPADQTVFLIMDRTSSGSTTLTYTVNVGVRTPNCTPGDPPSCADATTLQYCDNIGFLQSYNCGGALGTCTAGACDSPTADVCVDAGVLTHGARITGDFLGADNFSPSEGTHGACTFAAGDAPDGVDHFFTVDLLAGEWLLANYSTTTTSALAYLVGTCGDISTCRAATAEGADGRLAYQATVNETLTFVIDRTTTGSSAISWNLDVIIATPSCTPGVTRCAADGTTLQWCDEYGIFEDWACATTCTAGACDVPSSEICADPIVLTDGSTVMDDFGGVNSIDIGVGAVGQCAFATDNQPGTDHFYRIDLTAGQTATVTLMSQSSYALMYFTRDCSSGPACLANTSAGLNSTLSYTAPVDESVFLVVDRSLSGSTPSLVYAIDVTIVN